MSAPKELTPQEQASYNQLENILDALTYSNKLNGEYLTEGPCTSVSITYLDKWNISVLMATDHDLRNVFTTLLQGISQLVDQFHKEHGIPKQQIINDAMLQLVKLASK